MLLRTSEGPCNVDCMTTTTSEQTVQTGTFYGALHFIAKCGIQTDETIMQAGLSAVADPESPSRLFFGDQTPVRVFTELRQLHAQEAESYGAGVRNVAVSGYFKFSEDARGERYLDQRALFVTDFKIMD